MQYLLLIYTEEIDPATVPAADQEAEMTAYRAFTREVTDRGYMRGGDALEPSSTATTVRVREGRTLISDGPFAETKEVLGGYYLIDCPDLDTAIEMAAKIPSAARGSIEIRPVWELPMSATPDAVMAAADAG
ncbi:MAG: YciI family protein [Candidatus Limnocylindrales bacterium]